LSLIVEFPDQSAVTLAGFGEDPGKLRIEDGTKKKPKAPSKSKPAPRRAA